ncbi:hypothetical protein OAP56_03465 [Rickettsiaceae bacterium]|nr:hypothetical protein [Rickettsiaceae bacterium]
MPRIFPQETIDDILTDRAFNTHHFEKGFSYSVSSDEISFESAIPHLINGGLAFENEYDSSDDALITLQQIPNTNNNASQGEESEESALSNFTILEQDTAYTHGTISASNYLYDQHSTNSDYMLLGTDIDIDSYKTI